MGGLPEILLPFAEDPGHSALCLDFDGTLAAIVSDPVAARPWPGVPELLARLAARFALVAVISGRPADFLHEVLGSPAGVRLIGLYGLGEVGPDARPWEPLIADVADRARAEAPTGIYVEPKGLTVTLHWRHAPETGAWAHAFAVREEAARGLRVYQGRMSLELRPPSTWTRARSSGRWWRACGRWRCSATTSATFRHSMSWQSWGHGGWRWPGSP